MYAFPNSELKKALQVKPQLICISHSLKDSVSSYEGIKTTAFLEISVLELGFSLLKIRLQ